MTVNTKKLAGVSERPTTHTRPQSPEDLTESFRQLIYSNTKSRRVKDSPMFRKHNEKVKNLARQKKKKPLSHRHPAGAFLGDLGRSSVRGMHHAQQPLPQLLSIG